MIPITLRQETPKDYREVEALTREAFWNQYSPRCNEHYLVHTLRSTPAFLSELDIVAEAEGRIVGNIVYTLAHIHLDRGGELEVLSFGPISVLPAMQRQGIGQRLITHSAALAREMGYRAILIYGDPDYYSRSGFVPAQNFGIGAADGLYRDALQALELVPRALTDMRGLFFESPAFEVDAEQCEIFDQAFPHKEKEEDNAAQKRFHEILQLHHPRENENDGHALQSSF